MSKQVENVLLIVVDALRTDRVGAYGGDSLTPNIDALAEDGEVFENCYSCINATDPLLTTLLTGLYPTTHGVLNHADDVTDKEKKYVSGIQPLPSLISDTHTSVAIDILGRWHTRGFSRYLRPGQVNRNAALSGRLLNALSSVLTRFPDPLEQQVRELYSGEQDGNASLPATAEEITDIAIESIETTAKPWFMLAHYWDTHLPYVPQEQQTLEVKQRTYDCGNMPLSSILKPIRGSEWGDRLESGILGNSKTVGDMCKKYDAGVVNVDRHVGRLVDHLKNNNEYEDTGIILLADHGESLTEHQIFFDHHGLYEPTTSVPCIIKAPDFSGREQAFVQHFDILPTILDILGKEYDGVVYDGRPLTPNDGGRNIERDAVYMEEALANRKRGIRTNEFTYIESLDENEKCGYCGISHGSDRELYDRDNDPEELENIIDERPETADRLSSKLEQWVSYRPDPVTDTADFDTEEVMNHLEALGYR